jgi:hypothetical protein
MTERSLSSLKLGRGCKSFDTTLQNFLGVLLMVFIP